MSNPKWIGLDISELYGNGLGADNQELLEGMERMEATIAELEADNKNILSNYAVLEATIAKKAKALEMLRESNEGLIATTELREAAREAVDAVRFQKPEHERAAIDALAALLEKK